MSDLVNHVVTKNGYMLTGDRRGIVTPYVSRHEVWNWAIENEITIEFQGSLAGHDLWYVKNDKDRLWFILRWS